MLDYAEERKSAEEFIKGTVKKLTPENKREVAAILLGMTIAQDTEKHPQAGVPQRG